jgi:hypothetical protein
MRGVTRPTCGIKVESGFFLMHVSFRTRRQCDLVALALLRTRETEVRHEIRMGCGWDADACLSLIDFHYVLLLLDLQ